MSTQVQENERREFEITLGSIREFTRTESGAANMLNLLQNLLATKLRDSGEVKLPHAETGEIMAAVISCKPAKGAVRLDVKVYPGFEHYDLSIKIPFLKSGEILLQPI